MAGASNAMASFRGAMVFLTVVAFGIAVPVYSLGETADRWLFTRVSYTNSPQFDAKLAALKANADEWNLIVSGSSEVRWGVNPDKLDEAFNSTANGVTVRSFNLGLDGFAPGLTYTLLKHGRILGESDQPRFLLIGLNLAEPIAIVSLEYAPDSCGELKKPILTSPFAIDTGLNVICEDPEDLSLSESLLRRIKLLNYRKPIRALVTGQELPELSSDITGRGFQPYPPAGADYYVTFEADQERMRREEPERYASLSDHIWPHAAAEGGALDEFLALGEELGVTVGFFFLPTNPVYFDTFGKNETVEENRRLMRQWADSRSAIFIDLGVKREYDPNVDYADFRHLSGVGADRFSSEIGEALAQNAEIKALLTSKSEHR